MLKDNYESKPIFWRWYGRVIDVKFTSGSLGKIKKSWTPHLNQYKPSAACSLAILLICLPFSIMIFVISGTFHQRTDYSLSSDFQCAGRIRFKDNIVYEFSQTYELWKKMLRKMLGNAIIQLRTIRQLTIEVHRLHEWQTLSSAWSLQEEVDIISDECHRLVGKYLTSQNLLKLFFHVSFPENSVYGEWTQPKLGD